MATTQHFSCEHAEIYGIECAILINVMQFLSHLDEFTYPEKHDGKTWVNLNPAEIHFICPYMKQREIELYIMKLVSRGVLQEEISSIDGKEYYAFTEEKKFIKQQQE